MSGSPRCKHARLVGREVVKLSASVSLQVCVESDTTVKISPYLPRIYQQFLPDQDSAPKFAARTARRETRHAWTMGNKKCEHGRVRYSCKDCGGSGNCEHGRERSKCKDCGGSGICEHGRHRYNCKDCGGGGMCEHGRRRSQCVDCGGVSICQHGRQRRFCKDCCGSGLCQQHLHEVQGSGCARGCGRTGGRDGSGSGGEYRVYSGALLVLNKQGGFAFLV